MKKTLLYLLITAPTWKVRSILSSNFFSHIDVISDKRISLQEQPVKDANEAYVRDCKLALLNSQYWWIS